MFGKSKSDDRQMEEVKWEFLRWMESLIAVRSNVLRHPGTSSRLMALLDATGEAGTPEEWASAFVEKLTTLAGEAAASDVGAALALDQSRAFCQAKVRSLVAEHQEELRRLRSTLEEEKEQRRRVEAALQAAERARSDAERRLADCMAENMELGDRVRAQSRVIATQQERLNRCG